MRVSIVCSQAEIESALEEVCSVLPKTISAECTAFVQEYGPMVIKLLIEEVTPDAICTALGLCAGDKKLPGLLRKLSSCLQLFKTFAV
jgi:saposin